MYYILLTLFFFFFNRLSLQASHMEVYQNSKRATISLARWEQPLPEKLVYLVIDHQF
jgi:hypothetical protein